MFIQTAGGYTWCYCGSFCQGTVPDVQSCLIAGETPPHDALADLCIPTCSLPHVDSFDNFSGSVFSPFHPFLTSSYSGSCPG